MGNAVSFRLNPKCESDRKILAWLEEKSRQPGYLNQTDLIKQALLLAMESEQRGIREKETIRELLDLKFKILPALEDVACGKKRRRKSREDGDD